jgi:K+/H+ antiporter YhaU regulatory subunit KhtT
MRWKYQTNRFAGCNCGSKDFRFISLRNKRSVEIVLECTKCKEKWVNVWEDRHPIHQMKKIVYDIDLSEAQVQSILDEAEEKIRRFLTLELKKLLSQ